MVRSRNSNFHGVSPTATSTLRVYQFRHDRMPTVIPLRHPEKDGAVGRVLQMRAPHIKRDGPGYAPRDKH